MNGDIDPRKGAHFNGSLHLLWNATHRKGSKDFKPNHFVPLNPEGSVGSFSLSQSKIDFSHAKVVSKGTEVSVSKLNAKPHASATETQTGTKRSYPLEIKQGQNIKVQN